MAKNTSYVRGVDVSGSSSQIKIVLRWIAVLPGAIFGGLFPAIVIGRLLTIMIPQNTHSFFVACLSTCCFWCGFLFDCPLHLTISQASCHNYCNFGLSLFSVCVVYVCQSALSHSALCSRASIRNNKGVHSQGFYTASRSFRPRPPGI